MARGYLPESAGIDPPSCQSVQFPESFGRAADFSGRRDSPSDRVGGSRVACGPGRTLPAMSPATTSGGRSAVSVTHAPSSFARINRASRTARGAPSSSHRRRCSFNCQLSWRLSTDGDKTRSVAPTWSLKTAGRRTRGWRSSARAAPCGCGEVGWECMIVPQRTLSAWLTLVLERQSPGERRQ